MNLKTFNYEVMTDGISLNNIGILYEEFFVRKDYEWWYSVLPDDVVVDIGACIGLFSCHALDNGASKVYMIEPSKKLLKSAIYNVSPYMMDTQNPRVIPINYAIGKSEKDLKNVFVDAKTKEVEEYKLMSFEEFILKYDINHIDYLKIDCEGSEYDILTKDSYEFMRNNVRHLAIECHLNAHDDSKEKFVKFREEFLQRFINENKVRYIYSEVAQSIYDVNKLPSFFMVYITNY